MGARNRDLARWDWRVGRGKKRGGGKENGPAKWGSAHGEKKGLARKSVSLTSKKIKRK